MKKIILLLSVLLAGCQTDSQYYGTGPLVLSDRVVKMYREDYLKKAGPLVFYVSQDGRVGWYWYCDAGPSECRSTAELGLTLDRCAKIAGVPCFVLDERGWVVWNGPITWGGTASPSNLSRHSNSKDEAPDTKGRSMFDMTDVELCKQALGLYANRPVWTTAPKNMGFAFMAHSRGLTPDSCHKLLNP